MNHRNHVLLAALPLLLAASLAPTAAAQDVPDLRSMAFLSGTCERLVIVGEDMSDVCRGPVYNTTYHSGRISFAFPGGADDNSLILSFSGTEEQREGDRVMLRLDRITLAGNAEEGAATEAAEGICEYGDAYVGPMRITCAGRTRRGDFVGIFVSDGKPPTVQEF